LDPKKEGDRTILKTFFPAFLNMNNKLFISCVESRMQQANQWYNRFEIGPFPAGQALTVANALRRTLLGTQTGVFLTAVEIQGAVHEYARLEGMKDSILDILLNLRQISLVPTADADPQATYLGYFDLQGPLEVKAKHLKFPPQIECNNPEQPVATLTRNGRFQGRFLVTSQAVGALKTQSMGDPVPFPESLEKANLLDRFQDVNWLYVNPITNAIRRVNYVVEQFGDVWEQQEVVVLEVWTNGTIHPKQAVHAACSRLANIFSALSLSSTSSLKTPAQFLKFKKLKTDASEDLAGEKLTLLLDLDITNLALSLKTYLLLKKLKIENLGNLLQYKKEEFVKVASLSATQREEIEDALKSFGLRF
jgi:DNA-directed RNA polymerase subunit alpha